MSVWIEVWGKEEKGDPKVLLMSFPAGEDLEGCRDHAKATKEMLERQGVTEVEIKEVDQG